MITIAVLIGASLAVLAYLYATAPEGFEDADGFHFGPAPPFIADERNGTPIEHVFRPRHDALRDVPEQFHAEASSEGVGRNHA